MNKIKILTRNDAEKTFIKNDDGRNAKKAENNATKTRVILKTTTTTAPTTNEKLEGDNGEVRHVSEKMRLQCNRINLIDRKAASKIFQAATRDIKISAKNS